MLSEKIVKRTNLLNTFLCIGLDPDYNLLSNYNLENDVFTYNKAIIDSTNEYAIAFKPQFAHYAAISQEEGLLKTIRYIKNTYPDIPVLLDAKRGDIGSTAEQYAKESFVRYQVDAVTLNPYMGLETLEPFYSYNEKGCIVLIKTSNPGSKDFQDLELSNGQLLYQHIANRVVTKFGDTRTMFVVGATCDEELLELRKKFPSVTFLVPGVGHQGGKLDNVIKYGMTKNGTGLLINISRGITGLSEPGCNFDNYIDIVSRKAKEWSKNMGSLRERYHA